MSLLSGMHNRNGNFVGPVEQIPLHTITGVNQYGGKIGISIDTRSIDRDLKRRMVNEACEPHVNAWRAEYRSINGRDPSWEDENHVRVTKFCRIREEYPIVLERVYPEAAPLRPWSSSSGAAFEIKLDLSVPHAGGINGGGSEVQVYISVFDRKSKKSLWIGAKLFDSRAGELVEFFKFDKDTSSYIISEPVSSSMKYFEKVGWSDVVHSSNATSVPFRETRRYHLRLSRERLLMAADLARNSAPELSALSTSANTYEIRSWNVNPEAFAKRDQDGWIHSNLKVHFAGTVKNGQGLFRIGAGLFLKRATTYCAFVSGQHMSAAGYNQDHYDQAPQIMTKPTNATFTGACPLPRGLYRSEAMGLYSNGTKLCYFRSADQLKSYGFTQTDYDLSVQVGDLTQIPYSECP